jgi:hypothetical protein
VVTSDASLTGKLACNPGMCSRLEMEMVMLDLLELMVKPEGEDLGVLLEKEILK